MTGTAIGNDMLLLDIGVNCLMLLPSIHVLSSCIGILTAIILVTSDRLCS